MKRAIIFSICVLFLCTACGNPQTLKKVKETSRFVYCCSTQDIKVVDDIDKVLETNCSQICRNLQYEYKGKITVEVYPDQKSYDESLSDKSVTGSPACSGNRKIKLVSPASPIKIFGIPYEERLLMAVHEYVHLMIDEINSETPIWLDEGLACYEGSRVGYAEISRLVFPKIPEIDFSKLENAYYDIPAPDIYSYSAVSYIIEHFGYEKLNELIRDPSDLERILSMSRDEFSREWNTFIRGNYINTNREG